MLTAAGCDPVVELDTDHAPMVSRTEKRVSRARADSAVAPA
jgi:hypothetical protein